ncbi:hypothetical protein [Brevundimonas sp.]|uniref:hypothetical protein n=1 Tax=Brevundimonas sp. TaxID=1871086 RepID=UPI002FC9AB43
MKPQRIRTLTSNERELAREVFGNAIGLDRVRVFRSPWPLVRAFVPGRWFGREWISWPDRYYHADMALAPLAIQAIFVHEMVHVWQAQQGVNLLFAKIRAGDSTASYTYPVSDICHWDGLNIEQQAMVVEHRFRLSRGLKVPADMMFYDRVCPIGREPNDKIIA